jgi:hypothetical protein
MDLKLNLTGNNIGYWEATTERPSDMVPLVVLTNNIKIASIKLKLSMLPDIGSAWAYLVKEFEEATVMNTCQVARQLINANLKASDRNVLTKLDRHRRLVQALHSFLPAQDAPTIDAVCNLIFYCQLQGYQCLGDFNLITAAELDLDLLESSLKGELYATNLANYHCSPPTSNVTLATCNHDKKYLKDSKCRVCHPCPTCSTKELMYTYHVTTPGCDQNNPTKTRKTPPTVNLTSPPTSPTANLIRPSSVKFTVDSGCSDTMIANKDVLHLYSNCQFDHLTLAGGDHTLPIHGAGSIDVDTANGPATLHNVFHAPDLTQNLLSVSRLDDNGYASIFSNGFHLFPKDLVQAFIDEFSSSKILSGIRQGNLYETEMPLRTFKIDTPMAMLTGVMSRTLYDWHLALNHLNYTTLLQMSTMIDGMTISDKNHKHCSACHLSKAKSIKHPAQTSRTFQRIGEQVNADWIEGLTTGINGETISLHFYDRFSKKSFVTNLKSKTLIQQACIELCQRFKTHTGRAIGLLLFDQGSNFTANALETYCANEGIQLRFSPVDNPAINSSAERLHRTLKDPTRTILTQTGLPLYLWPYVIDYVNYIRNICPVAGMDKVPDHIWHNRKPHVSHLQPFGIPCYPKFPNKDIKHNDTFGPRASSAIFAGYDERIYGYRCLDIDNYQLIVCPDVTFDRSFTFPAASHSRFTEPEILDDAALPTADSSYVTSLDDRDEVSTAFSGDGDEDDLILSETDNLFSTNETLTPLTQPLAHDTSTLAVSSADTSSALVEDMPAVTNSIDSPHNVSEEQVFHDSHTGSFTFQSLDTPAPRAISNPPLHPKRISRPPKANLTAIRDTGEIPTAYISRAHLSTSPIAFVSQLLPPPNHYRQIDGRPDAAAWQAAADEEVAGLHKKGFIRKLIPRSSVPQDCLIYKSRFVFTRKSTGKAKARWVIRGDMRKRHAHRHPEQYDNTYSTYAPVAENATFKVLASITAHEDLEFEQCDVDQAFLNAKHPGIVYVEQPEGYEASGKTDWIIILNIGVYGLPESPLLWNEELDTCLKSQQFVPSPADPCLYIKQTENGYFYILVHVDDLVMAHKDMTAITTLKNFLHLKYGIKDLGAVKRFTSYQVTRNRSDRTITLHQHDYISELLQLTQMQNAIPMESLPVSLNFLNKTQCPKTADDRYDMEKVPYRQTVGALLHIANRTRPDICHAISVLTRYNHNPGKPHWQAVKAVLRFLKGTSTDGLVLGGKDHLHLQAYVDANFAQDADSMKSTSGFIFLLGPGAVSYKSCLQKAVTTSSTEAEIAALFISSTEAIWLRRLLTSMGYQQLAPTVLHEDNQAAIKFIRSKETHGRLKHIAIKHLFLRQTIDDQELTLRYVPSHDNPADIATKSLPKDAFNRHRRAIGIKNSTQE